MKALPPPGPERRRLFILLALLATVGVYAYYNYFRTDTVSSPPTTTARASSNPVDAVLKTTPQAKPGAKGALPGATDGQMPQPLKLSEIENKLPEEPEAGRNLFRFGVKYVPPPPPPPPPQPQAPVVVGPPPPPPIPPIPLKYFSFTTMPDGKTNVAWLSDKSGAVFQAVEGDVVDGRYKLLKVTRQFVEMEYLQKFPQGTGRRTIMLNGGGE